MRELIEFLAKSLVDHPDEVKTRTYERGEQGTVIELEVNEADLGKVIGRQGRTARALRTLLSAAGQKSRRRYSLDIVD
ncbi:MAG: KH domain-containing protein [Acidobacteriota bacterium]|nr:KH domain-containing protein [Acidobacteriota bacterium]